MKRLILLALIATSYLVSADEVNKMATIDGEATQSLYMDNGLPMYSFIKSLVMLPFYIKSIP